MKKLNLNGIWQMEGGGFNCRDDVPGSVYSFLLNNKLMPDPYFRDNELEALKLLENDFVFSRKFRIEKANYQMLLHCDGLDTLCDIFINDQHIAHTDNMHRGYEFDITAALKDGENEISLIFAPIMISCEEIGETDTRPFVVMQPDLYDYSTQARLSVANETTKDVSGVVSWALRAKDSTILQSGNECVTVPALTSVWLDNMDFNKTDVENNYLSFNFAVDGIVVSEGTALFTVPKHFNFVDPNLKYEIDGNEITVYADGFAKYVEIYSPDSDFILSDNYFDMNAGKKTVKIIEGTPKTIKLRSVYDVQ